MNYENGRRLSPEVIQSVRFVVKVGLMSKQTWNLLFGRGKIRWRQTQWKYLIDSKIFRPHPCSVVSDVVVIGDYGKKLTQKQGWKYSVSFQPKYIDHDEIVGIGMWKLEQAGMCKKWMHEKEMKTKKLELFKLQIGKDRFKYPDAIFLVDGKEKELMVAVEYENENSTMWNYVPLLKAYLGNGNFDRILFVVANKETEKRIRMTIKKIGNASLTSKIEFIEIEKWLGRSVRQSIPYAQTSAA